MKVINTNLQDNKQLINFKNIGLDYQNGLQVGVCHNPLTVTTPWNSSSYSNLIGITKTKPIINTIQTKKALLQAFHLIISILKRKGHILIVNTENSAHFSNINNFILSYELEQLQKSGIFNERILNFLNHERVAICFEKWIPGTLTNFKQQSKSIYSYVKFAEIFKLTGSDMLDNSNEILNFPRYYATSHKYRGYISTKPIYASLKEKSLKVQYIEDGEKILYKHKFFATSKSVKVDIESKMTLPLNGRPDLIILLNPDKNKSIISEANKLHLPVMAFVNSSMQNKGIDYPILCNSSVNFQYYFLKKLIKLCSIYK